MVVWWTTRVESISALVRRSREGLAGAEGEERTRTVLKDLAHGWLEVQPTVRLRSLAERILARQLARCSWRRPCGGAKVSRREEASYAWTDGCGKPPERRGSPFYRAWSRRESSFFRETRNSHGRLLASRGLMPST